MPVWSALCIHHTKRHGGQTELDPVHAGVGGATAMSFDTLLVGRRARAVLTTDRLLDLYRHARRTYPEE